MRTCRTFTPAEDARMTALRVDGHSLAQIASTLGRSKSSIQVRLVMLALRAEGDDWRTAWQWGISP